MSCNGCRILRKGCSDTCILRPSLQLIDSAEAQAHATVFVAKFFGRAGLMSFISAVPENQRPALFQSLLFEAAGRTVNPVSGALGLLWTGNWHVCQAAVGTVLRGGALHPIPADFDCTDIFKPDAPDSRRKRRRSPDAAADAVQPADLDLSLTAGFPAEKQRLGSSSINSEESVMTSCADRSGIQILKLFN